MDLARLVGVVNDKELKRSIEHINGEISAHLEKIVGRECVRIESYFKVTRRYPSGDLRHSLRAHSMLRPRAR